MKGFAKILCVPQQIEDSDPAFVRAVSLAGINNAQLTVVHVVPRIKSMSHATRSEGVGRISESLVDSRQKLLDSLVAPYRGSIEIAAKVITGTRYLEMVRSELGERHDLVIRTTLPKAWSNRLLAGDDIHLLRECPCPVWLIKSHSATALKRVLVAIDADGDYPQSELDIRRQLNTSLVIKAASLAIQYSAELHIAYAWQSWYEIIREIAFASGIPRERWHAAARGERMAHKILLNGAIKAMRSECGAVPDALDYLKPTLHLSHGPAAKEIPILADALAIDCVVMGTVARTGIRRIFLGNTAEKILDQIGSSVLAIKPRGFVSSVEECK